MKLKKSFTLIELIVVIVIMGVLATITFNILSKVYKHYIYTKEINKLDNRLDGTLNEMSSLLRNRVGNSIIATKYPSKKDEYSSDSVDFKPISELVKSDTDYIVLEWIGKDYEARYGMWDENQKHIQTGWSGFIDLDEATKTKDDPKEFNVTTINSNFDFVKQIDRNITAALGEDIDPFENNITTLIFSGYDMGGDLNPDVNQSFGWYFDKDKNRTAKSVFAIQNYIQHSNNSVDLNITSITENNNTTLYARYFLVRTAYSIVPIKDESSNDYNLTLYYNYQPWRKDWWNRLHGTSNTESNHTLILNHVTQFRFKKDTNSPFLRIYICLKSNLVDINATNKLEICKEKVIF
jgi:prepilin-type N-terminal cleavage/methylation domain-containing protein